MKTETKYFGEIEYEATDVLHFAKGIFAFEEEKRFLLLPFAGICQNGLPAKQRPQILQKEVV